MAITRPHLDPEDDLTATLDIDWQAALSDLERQRTTSPIIRPSTAAEVEPLIG